MSPYRQVADRATVQRTDTTFFIPAEVTHSSACIKCGCFARFLSAITSSPCLRVCVSSAARYLRRKVCGWVFRVGGRTVRSIRCNLILVRATWGLADGG